MVNHEKPNLDILLLGQGPDALSCARVLADFADLTVFQGPGHNIYPDLVILATGDLYDNIRAMSRFSGCNFLAIQSPMTKGAIGTYMLCGVKTVVEPICTKDELYRLIVTSSNVNGELSRRKTSKLINEDFFVNDDNTLSYKEAAYLGAIVRGLKDKEISEFFDTSIKDVRIETHRALQKLGIKRNKFRTPANMQRYGSITPGPRYRTYDIPKGRRHRSGYYVIPKFLEES